MQLWNYFQLSDENQSNEQMGPKIKTPQNS